MDIQWFPGHMANTKKLIQEQRGKVDVFLELLDARAPLSCRNPLLDELMGEKPRLVVLNKADLADPDVTAAWKRHFDALPATRALLVSSKERQGTGSIPQAAAALAKAARPNHTGPVSAMIVGIPNVGKSTLLNALTKRKIASVAPKPGHTRGPQRVRISDDFELVDTPGLLWHKFDDRAAAERLAMLGAIKDDVYDFHAICLMAIDFLTARYPKALAERYKLAASGEEAAAVLEEIGKRRGCVVKGGGIDIGRACDILMGDLRSGALGRFSLENPPEA
jgi:ribosome biogenesis GTPase A